MPIYTLRLLGDRDTPTHDESHAFQGEPNVGDQFLLDGTWREIEATEDDPAVGTVYVSRSAIPIGAFHVGGKYPAELYREEVRELLTYARRNRQANETPSRLEVEAALAALLDDRSAQPLSDDALGELSWTIHGLQVEN